MTKPRPLPEPPERVEGGRGRVRVELAPTLAFLVLVVLLGGDLVVWLLGRLAPDPAAALVQLGPGERRLFLGVPIAMATAAGMAWRHSRRARRARLGSPPPSG